MTQTNYTNNTQTQPNTSEASDLDFSLLLSPSEYEDWYKTQNLGNNVQINANLASDQVSSNLQSEKTHLDNAVAVTTLVIGAVLVATLSLVTLIPGFAKTVNTAQNRSDLLAEISRLEAENITLRNTIVASVPQEVLGVNNDMEELLFSAISEQLVVGKQNTISLGALGVNDFTSGKIYLKYIPTEVKFDTSNAKVIADNVLEYTMTESGSINLMITPTKAGDMKLEIISNDGVSKSLIKLRNGEMRFLKSNQPLIFDVK